MVYADEAEKKDAADLTSIAESRAVVKLSALLAAWHVFHAFIGCSLEELWPRYQEIRSIRCFRLIRVKP